METRNTFKGPSGNGGLITVDFTIKKQHGVNVYMKLSTVGLFLVSPVHPQVGLALQALLLSLCQAPNSLRADVSISAPNIVLLNYYENGF